MSFKNSYSINVVDNLWLNNIPKNYYIIVRKLFTKFNYMPNLFISQLKFMPVDIIEYLYKIINMYISLYRGTFLENCF